MSPRTQAAFKERRLLLITKTNARSRVHRRVAMDHVGVKHYDRDGRLTGGFQIVGLFTATAYTRSTRNIPYLRRKVAGVQARAGFGANSHSGRTLANVLDTYPRDELFQIDEDTLFHFASIILQLNERPRVRVLPRYDWFERFVSVLVYVPRESLWQRRARRHRPAARRRVRRRSRIVLSPTSRTARWCACISSSRAATAPLAHPDRARLESDVSRVMKTWPDFLLEALAAAHDPIAARDLFARYGEAFSPTYRDAFAAATAVQDIATIEAMSAEGPLGVDFQRGDSRRPPQAVEPRPPAAAVGTRAGAREYGFHRRRREHLSRRAPRAGRAAILAARHAAGIHRRRRPPISKWRGRGSTIVSAWSCAGMPKATATTRWCWSRG